MKNKVLLSLGKREGILVAHLTDGPALKRLKEFQDNDRQLKNCVVYCMEHIGDGMARIVPYEADGVTPLNEQELSTFSIYFNQYKRESEMFP